MPVKKFKDPFKTTSKVMEGLSGVSPSSHRKGGPTKETLETPNLPLPAPTSEGPSPYTLRQNSIVPIAPLSAPPGTSPKYNKDKLKDSWNSLSGQTMEYLLEVDDKTNESRLKTLLRETKLKDIGVLLGISTEKVLLMEGHIAPTIGQDEKRKLDEFLPEIMKEIQRRGASCTVTERKAEIKLNGK